ncbi:MAG: glycine betaine ABC transporter substrate-binding protein [Clostridiales bacterium]|nr:glycine betaine ABC transporter substrate-binding protein [Clostridiales bacterium]
MKMKKRFLAVVLMVLLGSSLLISGCTQSGENSESRGRVHIVYVEWVCGSASTHVIADVLQNIMGYDVELTPVSVALMFEALAQGEADFTTVASRPVMHAAYLERIADRVVDVGSHLRGVELGLVVPAYVEINSVEELNSIRNELNGEMIGIDPGAGMMIHAQKLIEEYELDLVLLEGSDATMTAALHAAILQNRPIVALGWRPHWKFSRWDLKFLDEPKQIFGASENYHVVARVGLQEDMPEVFELLQNFSWSMEDIESAIMMAEDSGSSVQAASDWVAQNRELVNSWLPEAFR